MFICFVLCLCVACVCASVLTLFVRCVRDLFYEVVWFVFVCFWARVFALCVCACCVFDFVCVTLYGLCLCFLCGCLMLCLLFVRVLLVI